jgi:hypothetical protein
MNRDDGRAFVNNWWEDVIDPNSSLFTFYFNCQELIDPGNVLLVADDSGAPRSAFIFNSQINKSVHRLLVSLRANAQAHCSFAILR